jgi:hypothetical protein
MKTAVVTLTDQGYFHKAKRTIIDIRSRGQWMGDLVLITVGFNAPQNFIDYYQVTTYRVEHIDTNELVEKYRKNPIRSTCDNRQFDKLTQWDKFYVFDSYFSKWDKVIYVDAGLRVFDKIHYLADLPCEGVIMAPDDSAPYDHNKRFGAIIETDLHPDVVSELFKEYSPNILNERYFLNCIWIYDTALLQHISFENLVESMNKYPICRCNEMTIMNLLFTFKHRVWKPFPEWIDHPRKRLFGWSEHDRDYGPYTTWRDFCFVKYPFSINFDCE